MLAVTNKISAKLLTPQHRVRVPGAGKESLSLWTVRPKLV